MHLTLKFLGEVSPSQLPGIEKALESAAEGLGLLNISIRGVGVFPNPKSPRVVWLGVRTVDERLARLHERIERAFVPLGFPIEKRAFQPHLTLGRVRSSRGHDDLMKAMEIHQDDFAGDCELSELHLVQSELRPEGAVYSKVRSVPL